MNPKIQVMVQRIKHAIEAGAGDLAAGAMAAPAYAQHATGRALEGVGQVGTDIADKGVLSALVGSGKQLVDRNNFKSVGNAAFAAGRTLPVTVPAGLGIKGLVDNMRDKEASDRHAVALLLEGFVQKCAEMGQDPEEMWKLAGWDVGNLMNNYLGSNPAAVPLVPESEGISGTFTNVGRRLGSIWQRMTQGTAGAKRYRSKLQGQNAQLSRTNELLNQQSGFDPNSMWMNPRTRNIEFNPAYEEQQYGTEQAPYWKARQETMRQRQSAFSPPRSTGFTSGGYSPVNSGY